MAVARITFESSSTVDNDLFPEKVVSGTTEWEHVGIGAHNNVCTYETSVKDHFVLFSAYKTFNAMLTELVSSSDKKPLKIISVIISIV
jgi:hypothetical protein